MYNSKLTDNLPNASGIYALRNVADNRIYVGSAKNLKKRIKAHLRQLRKQRHKNKRLASAWREDGDRFVITVLEVVPNVADLVQREQHWMDNLGVSDRTFGYNQAKKAVRSR